MDIFDKFFERYSYKFPKGYPDLTNDEDILLLESLINDILPNEQILLKETVQLSATQLIKPFHSNSEYYGKYKDRGERFLEKIQNDEPLELLDGKSIVIDKEKSEQGISYLENKKYNELGGQKKLFISKDGKAYSLSNFAKTKEFGSGSGKGGGSLQTDIQESTQCLVNALSYKNKGNITVEDLTEENLSKVKNIVFTTTSFEDMVDFATNKEWQNSLILTANTLYSNYPNPNFTFHRGSEFVQRLNNAFAKAKKEEGISLQKDKWNPSDIWMVDKSILDIEFETTFDTLNEQLLDLFNEGKLIGVSLKKLGKEASIQIFNGENSEQHKFTYEGYNSTNKSKMSTILFSDGGQIYFRSFNYADNFAGEIKGKNALAGKIGIGIINKFISGEKLTPIPSTKEIREKVYKEDKTFISEFHRLYSLYVEQLNDKEFKIKYQENNEDWRFSKYISLFLVDIFESSSTKKANNLINDMTSYAKSSSKISSIFIKVS